MNIKYLVMMVCTLVLTSCASKKDLKSMSNNSSLFENKWQIVELKGVAIKDKVNGKTPYLLLDKADQNYTVITGCNTLHGAMTVTNTNIKFANGISTMMFCEDMSVEDGFKAILSKVNSFQEDSSFLYLKDGNTVLVKLKKYIDSSIVGTSWQLDLLSEPGIDYKKVFNSEKKPTISFLEGNKIAGNGSCNNFNASMTLNGNSFNVGPIMSTKMMCSNLEAEQIFFNTLAKVNGISANGDTLNLLIGDIAVMRFKKI